MQTTRPSRRAIAGAVATLALLAGSIPAHSAPRGVQAVTSTTAAAVAKPTTRPGISPVLCYYAGLCI